MSVLSSPITTTPAPAFPEVASLSMDAPSTSQRICIVSEDLSGHPDEGAKKSTLAIADKLRQHHDVSLLSTQGPCEAAGVRWIPTSKTFLSRALAGEVRRYQPDVVLYATLKSATLFSFLRARLLRAYCPHARIAMFGWQTRRHPRWQQRIIRHALPDLVLVQSPDNLAYLSSLGCRCALIPSGVDTDRFQPVDEACRLELRARYGLDAGRPVVLHVGHLNEGRGVRVLIELARRGDCQVALVASTSSPQESALAAELRASGVTVFNDFLPYIEELYQLADCYVFPVVSSDNAIESPLSVFEALACDLPVVSTRFAGLPDLFGDDHPGLTFVDSPRDLIDRASATAHLPRGQRPPARDLVLAHSWEAVANRVVEQVIAIPATRRLTPQRAVSR